MQVDLENGSAIPGEGCDGVVGGLIDIVQFELRVSISASSPDDKVP